MLSKKEKCVMSYLFEVCNGKGSELISPNQIMEAVMNKYEMNEIEVDQIVNALALDEYIDVVNSDNKGKLVYCITLKAKGEAYLRESTNNKKTAAWLVTRTIALAILSFVVGMILKAIFK